MTTKLDTNQRNPDGSFKPKVEGVNAARCTKCGELGRTNRPRPEFLCVRCYVVRDIGRPLTKDDIRIVRTRTRKQRVQKPPIDCR